MQGLFEGKRELSLIMRCPCFAGARKAVVVVFVVDRKFFLGLVPTIFKHVILVYV